MRSSMFGEDSLGKYSFAKQSRRKSIFNKDILKKIKVLGGFPETTSFGKRFLRKSGFSNELFMKFKLWYEFFKNLKVC